MYVPTQVMDTVIWSAEVTLEWKSVALECNVEVNQVWVAKRRKKKKRRRKRLYY